MTASPSASQRAVEVFFSYAHEDEALRNELAKHLRFLERQAIIAGWHDRQITAGREWAGALDAHLQSAHIILLLVSADFLASDYCYDIEVRQAMALHEAKKARVIPIILRPVDWHSAPFGKLQALPKDGHAVTSWPNQDEAFVDVARGIRAVAEELVSLLVTPSLFPEAASMGRRTAPDLPDIWNVPYLRNPHFVGRDDLLAALWAAWKDAAAAPPQVLRGLGGVGKTQLVVEYAYRYANNYSAVWWIHADEPTALAQDYAALASILQLPEHTARDQAIVVAAVQRWLEHHTGWLLVFDNGQKPEEVLQYFPHSVTGHILVTSRNPNWRGIVTSLSISVLERAPAVTFLLQRTGQTDAAAANALAAAMGDLPLALEQAGAYLEATGTSLAAYLTLFYTRHTELWVEEHPPLDYPDTVATTWSLVMEQVCIEAPAGAELLALCAYLGPNEIPQTLICNGIKYLPASLTAIATNPLAMNRAIAALRRYSLVEVTAADLSVNRLVQTVVRNRLREDVQRRWAEVAVCLLDSVFPTESDDVSMWPACARLLPHALAAVGHTQGLHVAVSTTAHLLNQMGVYLCGRAQFTDAQKLLEQAMILTEEAYGAIHSQFARVINNLGTAMEGLGALANARTLYERALAIVESIYGPQHPQVGLEVNNLGSVLRKLGDPTGARACFEKALAIDEHVYGPQHPKVAGDINNLGSVLRELGDLTGARACFEKALAIIEYTYGPDHPESAGHINNLGRVLQALGDLVGACSHYKRALAVAESGYGPQHPTVATISNNLGTALESLGELLDARAHYEHALAIDQGTYGPQHPQVARDANNLGSVLQKLGDLAGAGVHYQWALNILQERWGEDHPYTVIVRSNLTSLSSI
jgi:tetratricopeptide (TPR) repeat protein